MITKKYKNLIIFCCIFIFGEVISQEGGQFTGAYLYYRQEISIRPFIHTQGWGLSAELAKRLTGFKKFTIEVNFFNLKHPKEIKTENPYVSGGKPFAIGKEFYTWGLDLLFGEKKIQYVKDRARSVQISTALEAGGVFIFQVPIYVIVAYPSIFNMEYARIERYNTDLHHPSRILGTASFFYGIGQSALIPGFFFRSYVEFDFSPIPEKILTLDCGVHSQLLLRKIELLRYQEKTFFLIQLFTGIKFGWKRS